MSLRLPQPYPATSSFHLQSHPCRLNLIFNTKIHFNFKHPTSKTSISTRRTTLPIITASATGLPARDRTIDFGRHNGTKLGAIPSRYLKWLTRRGSFEWAKLAEEVLKDPVYRDRIEWEIVHPDTRVERLKRDSDVELNPAERFGWDYEDSDGWSKVDEDLLGTSESGRIPRIVDRAKRVAAEREKARLLREKVREEAMKVKLARGLVGGERRRKMLERRRENLRKENPEVKKSEEEELEDEYREEEKIRVRRTRRKYRLGGSRQLAEYDFVDDDRTAQKVYNPFPGRQSLIERVFDCFE